MLCSADKGSVGRPEENRGVYEGPVPRPPQHQYDDAQLHSQAASPGICQQHMHTRTRQKLMQTHGSSTETTAHMNIYVLVIYKPKQITHTHTAKQREYYINCTQ